MSFISIGSSIAAATIDTAQSARLGYAPPAASHSAPTGADGDHDGSTSAAPDTSAGGRALNVKA